MQSFYWTVVNSSVRDEPLARFVFVVSRALFYFILLVALVIAPISLLAHGHLNQGEGNIIQSYLVAILVWPTVASIAVFLLTIIAAQIFKPVNYIFTGKAIDSEYSRPYFPDEFPAVSQLFDKLLTPAFETLVSPLVFVERLIDGNWRKKIKAKKQQEALVSFANYETDPDYREAIKEVESYLKGK